MKLSILICTIPEREEKFNSLSKEFHRQILRSGEQVEVLNNNAGRGTLTVGEKRQILLEQSCGEYIVYFDDDDWPYDNYLTDICEAIKLSPDCVGMIIDMTTNSKNFQRCCHSLKYPKWENKKDGFDYVRGVTHFNPVKRELALKAGFPFIPFGEDHEYSKRITPLCKKEVFLSNPLFHYRYENQTPHKIKYGIK